MKKYLFVSLLVACLFISGCGVARTSMIDTSILAKVIPTITSQPNPTATIPDEKTALLEEMQQAVFAYDHIVEDEKKKGTLIQATDQATKGES